MKTKFHSETSTSVTAEQLRDSVVIYGISRHEIENGFTDRLIHDLRVDPANPLIQAGIGNFIFMVTGYDDEPREIYEIPEFQSFIRKANESTPCWMYYAAPESLWLQTVAFCTLPSSHVSGSRPGFRTLSFSPFEATDFLDSQLDDCWKLSLIAEVTKKKSRKHLKRVYRGFGIELS